jgi:IS30 family transposase
MDAQRLTESRRRTDARLRIPEETWEWVGLLLREEWSPEQISGWLAAEKQIKISHEWIYQAVIDDKSQKGDLHLHLRCQKQRKKRYGAYSCRGQIKERVSIDERPSIVDERSRIGDWEADTVIGRQGGEVLVTLVERKTRLSLIGLAINKTAQAVKETILALLRPLMDQVKTLTYDNGKEFAYHKAISAALNSEAYFAHPYHSWERGLNENTNGLIRQYLPKKMDFKSVAEEDVRQIQNKLNNRPRKCLGFKTPNQLFFWINPPVALGS